MAAAAAGKFVSVLCALKGSSGQVKLGLTPACTLLQTRNYAARKGTREKARKKKVKVEVQKQEFIPHKERGLNSTIVPVEKIRIDDSQRKDLPEDNVWIGRYHKWRVYTFAEAVQCHKETHRLAMYAAPNAFVRAKIEMDMKGPRPSRPVTKFARIITAPHPYDHGEKRSVAVFCKTPEDQEAARKAGANIVGGPELISKVQTGEVSMADYEQVVAHPDMMAELVVIKGLLKRKFPTPAAGSLHGDVAGMVTKFLYGIKYSGEPHARQPLYGIADITFGRLSMDTEELHENFTAIVNDMNQHRPKRPGPFITRIWITTEIEKEMLKINHESYTGEEKAQDDDDDDEDEEGVAEAV